MFYPGLQDDPVCAATDLGGRAREGQRVGVVRGDDRHVRDAAGEGAVRDTKIIRGRRVAGRLAAERRDGLAQHGEHWHCA